MRRLLTLLLLTLGVAMADSALDGLALAMHPNGEVLVAGGKNRTLYTVSPDSLEVLNRTYIGTTVNKMAFSPDGTKLFVQDSEPDIHILNGKTLEIQATIADYGALTTAPEANLMAALDTNYKGDTVALFDMEGTEIKSLTFGEDDDVATIGISPDGTKLAVFFDDVDSETEEKVSWGDIPDEYEGFAKDVFSEQNDAKEARYMLYSLPDFEVLADYIGYYTPYDKDLVFFQGDDAIVISSNNENARYSKDETVEMWEWDGSSSAYGEGLSSDQNVLVVGGNGSATVIDYANDSTLNFDIDDIPGASEYFRSFVVTDEGIIYGSTDGYRIVKVTPAGAGVSKEVQAIF